MKMIEIYIRRLFDQLFEKEGGYYDPNSSKWPVLRTEMKAMLGSMREAINHSLNQFTEKPVVYIAFISSPRLGARVIKYKDSYFIGVYNGTISLLDSLFGKMLCNPKFLPLIGDASKEDEIRVDDPFIIDGIRLIENIENYPEDNRFPKDPQRISVAKLLTLQAVLFLTLHELGHIVEGHLEYKHSLQDVTNEILPKGQLSGIHSQSLEYRADAFATEKGIELCYIPYHKAEIGSVLYSNYLLNWGLAIYGLFSLFGLINYDKSRLESYSHPPTPIRIQLIMSGIRTNLKREIAGKFTEEGTGLDNIPEFVIAIQVLGEMGFKMITDSDETLKIKAESSNLTEKELSYCIKIIEEYVALHPMIRKFALNKKK